MFFSFWFFLKHIYNLITNKGSILNFRIRNLYIVENTNLRIPKIGTNTREKAEGFISLDNKSYLIQGRIVCSKGRVHFISNSIKYKGKFHPFYGITSLAFTIIDDNKNWSGAFIFGGLFNLFITNQLGDNDGNQSDTETFLKGGLVAATGEAIIEDQILQTIPGGYQFHLFEDFFIPR